MLSERGEPSLHGWSDKQFLGNVSATLQYFNFDQQSERFSKHSAFNFFVDWSMTDAKLFFEAPSQPGVMINNTVRLVCLYMLLMRELIS